jgi:hypothetical protein
MGDLINDAFAASAFNRELNALIAALARVADRLDAFAGAECALELVEALVARDVGRASAASAAAEFLHCADSPDVARDAAGALAWTITQALAEMRSVALRPPSRPRS